MSEPSQLYARLHLSRSHYEDLLASPFPDPSGDRAVLDWLATAQYYGERYTPATIRERLSGNTTVGAYIEDLMGPGVMGFPMPSRNEYDDKTETWTLGVLDFSENYDDYLAAVAVFRMAASFKDLPGDDGLLIYGCLWEDDAVSVALRVDMGASEFVAEDDAGWLVDAANVTMDELKAEGAALASEEA